MNENIIEIQVIKPQKTDVFDEDVRGMIIGGDWISWKLYYKGKSVGSNARTGMQHSDTEEEALEIAREMIKEAQAIAAICYPLRYNDKSQWHIRVFNG